MSEIQMLVLGSGGHARVLIELLLRSGMVIKGCLDLNPAKWGSLLDGVPIVGGDEFLEGAKPQEFALVNGIGSVGDPKLRTSVYAHWKERRFAFPVLCHPAAVVARSCALKDGAQIMAGGILQPGCCIGENTIINTNASIDHDCQIGAHVHIAPGVVVSGGVSIGEGSHLGTGAVVIQGVHIGKHCLIAAGAVVTQDLPDHAKAMGVPARIISRQRSGGEKR